MEDFDLRRILQIARRWWGLLILAPLVAGITAHLLQDQLTDDALVTYTAQATLLMSPVRASGLPNYSPVTYSQLIETSDVLLPVVDELALPFGFERLQDMVWAQPLADRQSSSGYADILWVYVSDTDPARAAAIADAVANSFMAFITEELATYNDPQRVAIEQKIEETQRDIEQLGQQIDLLESSSNPIDPLIQIELGILRAQLGELQDWYAQLVSTAQRLELDAAVAETQISVAQSAALPTQADPAERTVPALPIGVLAGLMIATAAIIVFERFDNSIKLTTDFVALTGAPLLSVIPRFSKPRSLHDHVFFLQRPSSPASESIRLLRANLDVLPEISDVKAFKSLMITSPESHDGKSTVTANLGVAMARAGNRVVIVDADLKDPYQHQIFGIKNDQGLTTLLSNGNIAWEQVSMNTMVRGLTLLPAGPSLPNSADLVTTGRLSDLLEQMGNAVDVVLVDSPSVLTGSEAIVVASSTDAVILVCQGRQTDLDALYGATIILKQATARLVGIVLNKQPGRDASNWFYWQEHAEPAIPSKSAEPAVVRWRVPNNGA